MMEFKSQDWRALCGIWELVSDVRPVGAQTDCSWGLLLGTGKKA